MRRNTPAELGAAIVALIGTRGPMSRATLARQLGVSPATVTNFTRTLIAEGALTETGTTPSAGGRPGILLDVVQRRRYALGVKVTPNHLTMAEVDINGEPEPGISVDLDMRAPNALDRIAEAIAERVADRTGTLLGVGLAVPGFSDPSAPDLVTAPTLGWNRVDLGRLVRDRTGLNVVIDNDVNALALAEQLYLRGSADDHLLITIGIGVGAAITSKGRILHGSRGGAGEFGHMMPMPNDNPCPCGLTGCLETLVGDDGLVREARSRGILGAGQGKNDLNLLAEAGDARAISLFADAGQILGLAVANLVHLLDPEAITVSGEGVDMWHHWNEGFLRGLRQRLPLHRRDIPVTTQPWSDDTWAYGAASLIFATPFAQGSS